MLPIILTNTDHQADYIALVDSTKKILAENGLEVQRDIETYHDGSARIIMRLVHLPSGQWIKSEYFLDQKKFKFLDVDHPTVFLYSRIMYEGLVGVAPSNDALVAAICGPAKVMGDKRVEMKEFHDPDALAFQAARIEGFLSIFSKPIPFFPDGERKKLLASLQDSLRSSVNQTRVNAQLSWSDIQLFWRCKRCFYNLKKFGVRLDSYDSDRFSLQKATEMLLRREFDGYREFKKQHPIMAGSAAIKPLKHKKLDKWRTMPNLENGYGNVGISFNNVWENWSVRGVVDDIWLNQEKEMIIVDYKSSTNGKLYPEYQQQIEFYAWIFRKNNYAVSKTGYVLMYRANTNRVTFDWKLDFEPVLHPIDIDDSWVQSTINDALECLSSDVIPEAGHNVLNKNKKCSPCDYFDNLTGKMGALKI